jgi:hypothetical protein
MSTITIAATTPTIPSTRNATDFPQSRHQFSASGGLSSFTGTTLGVLSLNPRSPGQCAGERAGQGTVGVT